MDVFFKIKNTVSKRIFTQLFFLILLLVLNSILEVVGVGMIIPIYKIIVSFDTFSNNYLSNYDFLFFLLDYNKSELLIFIFSLFFILVLAKYLVYIFLYKYAFYLTADLKAKIISKIFKYYSQQPYIFFKNKSSSVIVRDLLKEVAEFCDRFVFSCINFLLEIFVLLSVGIFFIFLESKLVLFFLIYSLISSIIFFSTIRKKIDKAGIIRSEIDEKKYSILQNFIKNIRSIKTRNKEEFFYEEFKNYIYRFEKTFAKFNFIQVLSKPFLELVGISFIILWTIIQLRSGSIIADLFLSLSLLALICIRVLPSINKIIFSLGQMKFSLPSRKIVYEELSKIDNEGIKLDKKELIKFNNSLELINISFNYNENENIIIDLNLKIKKGEKICLLGKSGTGKTTLVEIISGLLKQDKGEITLDGDKNFAFNKNILDIMYVPQDLLLLDGSIAQNISFSNDKIDHEKLNRAIKLADLEDYINKLKDKENSLVGELGNKLSGGQKQRIGLARCFYDNPEFIILDEALNAIDEKSKNKILENIFTFSKDKTVIFITHDIKFSKNFEKILYLENGKIQSYN